MLRHVHHLEHIGTVLKGGGDKAGAQGMAGKFLPIEARGCGVALYDFVPGRPESEIETPSLRACERCSIIGMTPGRDGGPRRRDMRTATGGAS
jgi:hypothetical protein